MSPPHEAYALHRSARLRIDGAALIDTFSGTALQHLSLPMMICSA